MYRKLQPRSTLLEDWSNMILQILFFGLFFFPESPRHLIATDREDEGLKVLKKLHYNGTNGMLLLSNPSIYTTLLMKTCR